MIVFIAFCYVFLVWFVYFKVELLPFDRRNKFISISIGVLLIGIITFIVLAVTPYSKNFFIVAKANPIAPRVSGQVVKIFVEPGQYVKQGDPLFQLNTKNYDIIVQEAKGKLHAAKGAYLKAKKQRSIALALQKADPESISQLQLINTEETMNQLRGEYEAAKSALDKALNDLSKTTVYAPSNGYIPYLAFENETPVSAYDPLMTFISSADMQPTASYSQNALAYVKPGDAVEFLLDIYPGHIFSGEVEEIVWVAGEAQIFQGQDIPEVNNIQPPTNYLVKLKWLDTETDPSLHFGLQGEVVIYTDHLKPFHIIQKVHLRMQAWLKYLAIH